MRDVNGAAAYKDVCNPITAEFREKLYGDIIEAFNAINDPEKGKNTDIEREMPDFSVTVTPYEKKGSNMRGLARVYFEDSFIVNNVSILQGKEKLFIAMPSYKTKQVDEQGKAIYQDVCYPVTKEFRERLYGEIEKNCAESNTKKRIIKMFLIFPNFL